MPLFEFLARFTSHGDLCGIVLIGTTGTEELAPTSDYDVLLVFAALPVPLRMVTAWVDKRLTEIYCTTAQTVARVAGRPDSWAAGSEEGHLVNWLKDGRIAFDRDGTLATAQAQVRRGSPPTMPSDDEVYEARRKIAYNVFQLRRYLAAGDEVSRVVVDLRLLYSLFEVAFHYFTVRRLPWRGEKKAVRYWAENDPTFLERLCQCLSEVQIHRKVEAYEALAQRALEPVGGLWEQGATFVALGAPWGAGAETVAVGTVDDALGYWHRLLIDDPRVERCNPDVT